MRGGSEYTCRNGAYLQCNEMCVKFIDLWLACFEFAIRYHVVARAAPPLDLGGHVPPTLTRWEGHGGQSLNYYFGKR